jgi:hypothetical protein
MYSIKEILIIQLLCFIIVFNSKSAVNYLKQIFPFFNGRFEEKINEFINFYKFICEHNPLLLNYYEETEETLILESTSENKDNDNNTDTNIVTRYEDKYLDKFKKFPNEYIFTEAELDGISEEYMKIRVEYEKDRFNKMNSIQERLSQIHEIQEKGNIQNDGNNFTKNMNGFGINTLLKFFEIEEEYDEDPDDFDIEELYMDLLRNKKKLIKELYDMENNVMSEDEMREKARDTIINKRLDKYIDNYVLEYTPLGNIYMRYNNNKKSFEYFSNNSIPYRYLEPVGRKYVTTYWCKPLFVDIEEELKKAEERFDEEKKKKEEEEKRLEEERKNNPRRILAQLKNYNKESKDVTMRPMKNRSNKNAVLPSQVKANLPDVNKPSEKQLLKENANRYTWEGRLTNFCPLKKIDKKKLDKKLAMTYADFKKMQQEQQNKK